MLAAPVVMPNAVEQEESQLVAPVGHEEEGEIPLVDDEIDDTRR